MISETAKPFPIASRRSVSTSSRLSMPLICSSMKSAISLSLGSSLNGMISKSSPVTAFFLVWSWLNRWGSFSSISSKSSICRRTSPASASLKISASLTGVSPLLGYSLYLSVTWATAISFVSGRRSGAGFCCGCFCRFCFLLIQPPPRYAGALSQNTRHPARRR